MKKTFYNMKMKSLVRKGLDIIGHLSFKRIILWSIPISIFIIGYLPFCTLDMMKGAYYFDDERGLNAYINTVTIYKKMMFITKGRTFNATCRNGEKFTIHLGWDNCVYIIKGETEKRILVYKMCLGRWTNMKFVYLYQFTRPEDQQAAIDEYEQAIYEQVLAKQQDRFMMFDTVNFIDINGSLIFYICIQPDGLPYGKQKYGFEVNIDNWKFRSGHGNYFDY